MANKKWWCVILEAGLLIDGVKVIKKKQEQKVSIRMLVKEYEFEHDLK